MSGTCKKRLMTGVNVTLGTPQLRPSSGAMDLHHRAAPERLGKALAGRRRQSCPVPRGGRPVPRIAFQDLDRRVSPCPYIVPDVKAPHAANFREVPMKKVEIADYGTPEAVAHCIEAPDVGPPGPGEVVFDVLAFPIN